MEKLLSDFIIGEQGVIKSVAVQKSISEKKHRSVTRLK